jgi:hypothetical protein
LRFSEIGKITDAWGPPVSGYAATRRARIGSPGWHCRRARALKAPFRMPLHMRVRVPLPVTSAAPPLLCSHLLRAPRRSPKPLRRRRLSQSAPSTASLRRPLLHSTIQLPCLLPVRYSPSTAPPCHRSHALCHNGRLPPPRKCWAKSAHASEPLREAATVPLSHCHAQAPLGRRSHRSTAVPDRCAVTPSRKLSGQARAHR